MLRRLLVSLLVFVGLTGPAGAVQLTGEEDGSPNYLSNACWYYKFADTNVTVNADGGCSIGDQTGAGGGDPVLINGSGVGDAAGVDLIEGTSGIDITFSAVPSPDTATFAFDPTELTNITFSAGGSASIVHTFNVSGTDTTATYGSGMLTLSHDLTISGDDLFMATNTSGAVLVADGTNFNPVVISGDIAIGTTGTAAIQANAVVLGTDTTGNYVATVADAGNSTVTVGGSGSETAAVTLDAVDVNCSNCIDGTDIALGSDTQGDVMYYDGTDWVRLAKGTAGQVLEMNAGATAPEWDTDDNSGAATAINDLADASGNGAVDLGDTAQTWSANTNDVTAIAQDVLAINYTNDAATDVLTQRLLVLNNASATGGTTETLLALDNKDNSAVTTGLSIVGSSSGAITTAIDASDAEIGTALAIGANTLTAADAGLVDLSAVSVTSATEGLLLPRHATDCSTSGTAEGQACWESDADTLYVGDGTTVKKLIPDRILYWPGSSTLPLEPAEAWPPTAKDVGTNSDMLVLDFDQSTDECRTVTFQINPNISSGGTVTFTVIWYSASVTTNNVMWDFRHNSGTAAGVDPDAALTAVAASASAVAGTAGQTTFTTWTETQTNLAWVANDLVIGEFCRDADHASDTFAADARVIGVSIRIPQS